MLTVETANEIQARWMSLDSSATEAEKQAVFKDMKKFPSCYFSISSDGKTASIIYQGSPLCRPMPLNECVKIPAASQVKTNLAWQSDKWIEFTK